MVGWAGLPPSARQLLEPVSESNTQGSRPIEPIAWTVDIARANGAGCCVHALGANPANPRRAGAPDLLQNLVLAAVRLAPGSGEFCLGRCSGGLGFAAINQPPRSKQTPTRCRPSTVIRACTAMAAMGPPARMAGWRAAAAPTAAAAPSPGAPRPTSWDDPDTAQCDGIDFLQGLRSCLDQRG